MSPNHRNNGRAPRLGRRHLLLVGRIQGGDFRRQVRIHERSFFSRSSHNFLCRDEACLVSETRQATSLQNCYPFLRRFPHDSTATLFILVFVPRILMAPPLPRARSPPCFPF